MGAIETKYRHEMKYVISTAQIPLLKSRIEHIMQKDPHVSQDGKYTIRSLYFDDYTNRCYYENENGTDPREKFRIRIYEQSLERITLECKRKECGKTLKTSCPLTLEQAKQLIKGESLSDIESLPPLLRKMILQMRLNLFKPVVIVEYERTPYIYRNGNVRVTFDTNMSSAANTADFLLSDLPKRPIMPVGQHLLEVKFDEYLPDAIYRSLNLGCLQRTAYSKYYLCRKFGLHT